ncbi:hypothetical protein NIES4072_66630 [Nostoc commune NIES-4072]|jgi:hypothetical protein|uniref:Uncharacterized protein n=1 Tax=Nostoc commune NIES-4072 TaxID=2005467 RepID=A0A2R5G4H5_NOSCO|nr:hypothetical protein NIES4070_67080 [Nostoc commune HK-02]GBG22951.1 hypothetical protein NIES4072_66630 [Nostoc commune NIES-4072]
MDLNSPLIYSDGVNSDGVNFDVFNVSSYSKKLTFAVRGGRTKKLVEKW